ncbi:P1 family peptidase [Tissierella creatinini]|nr:P1 family peptidase [Tissierella creatinini]TJX63726.1 P1 family peptidase [Soehngenia saccharolytica]
MYPGYITDVEGIKVGHAQSYEGMTGCSVIICKEGATGGVDVRGSAPGTRETDLFGSKKMIDRIHAIVLSGGSAFGLDASGGVMKYLEENSIGFDVGVTKVPIVASAVLFDLDIGDYSIRPDFNMGYIAAQSASSKESRQGNVGCGLGATVGKILGSRGAMKSGLGSASLKVGDLIVSALVGVNAFGDIYDYKSNEQIAGVYDYKNGVMLNTIEILKSMAIKLEFNQKNTTIGIIVTNAVLNKAQANKVSEMGHDGYARSINPIHTMFDGDTIFTMATNKVESDVSLVGTLGAEAMSMAIYNAVINAQGHEAILSYKDIKKVLYNI